jgi:hypothetical protein
MLNSLLEDYYLANYLLYPRTVLVDEPQVAVNGVRGDAVGHALTAERLADLGITHLIIVDPSHQSFRVRPLERPKHD